MNWEAIGAIGEVIGAIAVILTLIYLSVQIRQNTRMMEDHFRGVDLSAFNAIDESFSRFRSMLAMNPELADLWKRTREDYEVLSGTERERADALAWEWFVIYQNMYHRTISIMQKDDTGIELALTRELRHPGLLQWWKQNRDDRVVLFPEFKAVVDQIADAMEKAGAGG